MELAPLRRPRPRMARLLAILTAVLTVWLFVLVVVPAALGLKPSVVTQSGAGPAAGTVVFSRGVPVSDVRAGDRLALAGDVLRVVRAEPGVLVTDATARTRAEAELAAPDWGSVQQVIVTVPVLGLPFLSLSEVLRWSVVVLLGLLAVVQWPGKRRERSPRALTPLSIGRVSIG